MIFCFPIIVGAQSLSEKEYMRFEVVDPILKESIEKTVRTFEDCLDTSLTRPRFITTLYLNFDTVSLYDCYNEARLHFEIVRSIFYQENSSDYVAVIRVNDHYVFIKGGQNLFWLDITTDKVVFRPPVNPAFKPNGIIMNCSYKIKNGTLVDPIGDCCWVKGE